MPLEETLAKRQEARRAALDRKKLERRAAKVDALRSHEREQELLESAMQLPTRGAKLFWLRASADAVDGAVRKAEVAACRSGCSHCCHDGVPLSQFEAMAIAQELQIEIAEPPRHYAAAALLALDEPGLALYRLADQERGRGPCPFLKDGRCRIYNARPLRCRLRHNLDDDGLLCEPIENQGRAVPAVNLGDYWDVELVSWGDQACYADIRDWFPNGLLP